RGWGGTRRVTGRSGCGVYVCRAPHSPPHDPRTRGGETLAPGPPQGYVAGVTSGSSPPGETSVYKICTPASSALAQRSGELPASDADARDGYVHLSTAKQVRGSLARHFFGQADLLLLELPSAGLPAGALRWEPARGGELFPHLYAPLRPELVARVLPVQFD